MNHKYDNFTKETLDLIGGYHRTLKKTDNYVELVRMLSKGFAYFNKYFPLNRGKNWRNYLVIRGEVIATRILDDTTVFFPTLSINNPFEELLLVANHIWEYINNGEQVIKNSYPSENDIKKEATLSLCRELIEKNRDEHLNLLETFLDNDKLFYEKVKSVPNKDFKFGYANFMKSNLDDFAMLIMHSKDFGYDFDRAFKKDMVISNLKEKYKTGIDIYNRTLSENIGF